MTQAIRKFLALPWVERRVLVQAMSTLPLLTLAVAVLGPRRCYRGLARLTPMADGSAPTEVNACLRASRIGTLVQIASRHGPVRGSCLVQSMTVWWLLRRQQIPAELRIGVRKRRERLEAHAWAEFRGVILNDDADVAERYAPFSCVGGLFEAHGAEVP
jgi:hypothetical protein